MEEMGSIEAQWRGNPGKKKKSYYSLVVSGIE